METQRLSQVPWLAQFHTHKQQNLALNPELVRSGSVQELKHMLWGQNRNYYPFCHLQANDKSINLLMPQFPLL
jgi:hypothetical protein